MKILMVEPGKAPYEAEIDGSLESMQEAVGGSIEGYYPYAEPVAIVCNDEGKINGLPLNRAIYGQDGEMIEIMAGTFFMAGLGGESFTDLPDYFMEQYKEQFKYPEKFFRIAGEIVAVKQPIPQEEKAQPSPAVEGTGGDGVRLDESMDLAFDLDEFFRKNSPNYAAIFRDPHEQKERLADALLSGRTDRIRNRLASLEQNQKFILGEAAPFMERIAAYEKEYGINTYSIYQLEHSEHADQYLFMSYDWLERKGLSVDRDDYRMVYAAQLEPGTTLEDIYTRFNIDHPEDFKGHSLSVSDVVVLNKNGADTAYYVDSFGFKEIPGFLETGRQPEAEQDMSLRGQLDSAKKQAAQAAPKLPDKKNREPERS